MMTSTIRAVVGHDWAYSMRLLVESQPSHLVCITLNQAVVVFEFSACSGGQQNMGSAACGDELP